MRVIAYNHEMRTIRWGQTEIRFGIYVFAVVLWHWLLAIAANDDDSSSVTTTEFLNLT